ncbi:NADAR family protein [Clostridium perfringens]|uniref:NADAR family protein n=1 Tax=Clostridium perfringens TaxID=1502 RepID=UPI0024BBEE03|nr:NADAR family protein [Clostridium perfringens]MDU1017514.1 NADAR family protein [Clostridium perfringens]
MIKEFKGKYYFLSNYSKSDIKINDITFLNAESAFHSFKDMKRQSQFANLDPATAKRKGRNVKLREDWESVKDEIMYLVVKEKFKQNKELREKLIETGNEYLEEGNTWNDTYWGVCNGIGKNKLGKILMKVRSEMKNIELIK